MITASQPQNRVARAIGWVILFALGLLMVMNVLLVLIEDGASQFALDTGASWNEFAAAYPGVAAAYTLSQRLLFLYFAALGLFTLVTAWFGLRSGRRWAWYVLWAVPATLALTALLILQSSRPEIGAMYAGLALLAVAALLLPIRSLLGKNPPSGGEIT